MKCTKMIFGMLLLLAVTMTDMSAQEVNRTCPSVDTSAQEVDRKYCSLNFTTPERCLCGGKDDWQDEDDEYSTVELLRGPCKPVR